MSNQTGLRTRQRPFSLTASAGSLTLTGEAATLTFTPVPVWNQSVWNGTQSATATTLKAAWGAPLGGPSVIVVHVYQFVTGGTTLSSVTDSAGNSYSLVASNAVGTLHGYIYVASNNSTASGITITATTALAAHMVLGAVEMLGVSSTATASATDPQSSAGNTPNAGTLASVPANGIAIVSFGCAAHPSLLAMPDTPDGSTVTTAGGTLPTATIPVGHTGGFPGWIIESAFNLDHSGSFSTVTFTGTTPSSFTGCAGGSGAFSLNDAVTSAVPPVVNLLTPTYDIGFSLGNYYSPSSQTNLALPWHGTVSAGSLGLSASFATNAPTVH